MGLIRRRNNLPPVYIYREAWERLRKENKDLIHLMDSVLKETIDRWLKEKVK